MAGKITMQPQQPQHPSTTSVRPNQQRVVPPLNRPSTPQPAMPQQQDGIKTFVKPEFRPTSEKDSRYTSVGLSSNFYFYDWKQISIRPFVLGSLKKVFRAGISTNGDLRSLVEAIGSVIDKDVFELTIGDWWNLMYWLRFNSYKKHPLFVKFVCDNEDHIENVNIGKLLERTLENQEVIAQGQVDPVLLDVEKVDAAIKKFKADYNINITSPRVYDFVEAFEYNRDNPDDDSGIQYMFRFAICLPKEYGNTIIERAQWLEDNDISADATVDLEAFSNLADHGVKELVNLKCKECGASKERPLSIDALSFLPHI